MADAQRCPRKLGEGHGGVKRRGKAASRDCSQQRRHPSARRFTRDSSYHLVVCALLRPGVGCWACLRPLALWVSSSGTSQHHSYHERGCAGRKLTGELLCCGLLVRVDRATVPLAERLASTSLRLVSGASRRGAGAHPHTRTRMPKSEHCGSLRRTGHASRPPPPSLGCVAVPGRHRPAACRSLARC